MGARVQPIVENGLGGPFGPNILDLSGGRETFVLGVLTKSNCRNLGLIHEINLLNLINRLIMD